MKKIDVLNFITDFRKSPNQIRTYRDILNHIGSENELQLNQFIDELKTTKVLKETEVNGEKAFQVIGR